MNALAKEVPVIIPVRDFSRQVKILDWERILNDLDAHGCAAVENLVAPEECGALAGLYAVDDIFAAGS
jgi:hypothetical protein